MKAVTSSRWLNSKNNALCRLLSYPILSYSIQFSTILSYSILFYSIVLYCILSYRTTPYCLAWYRVLSSLLTNNVWFNLLTSLGLICIVLSRISVTRIFFLCSAAAFKSLGVVSKGFKEGRRNIFKKENKKGKKEYSSTALVTKKRDCTGAKWRERER